MANLSATQRAKVNVCFMQRKDHDDAVEAVVAGTNALYKRIPSRAAVSEFLTEYWAPLKAHLSKDKPDAAIAQAVLQYAETKGKREALFQDPKGPQHSVLMRTEEHDEAVEAVVSGASRITGRIPPRTAVSEFISEHWAKLKLTCQTESDVKSAEAVLQLAETEGKREWLFLDQEARCGWPSSPMDSWNSNVPATRYKLWRPARAKSSPPPTSQGSGSKGNNKGGKDDQSSSDEDAWGKHWRGDHPLAKAKPKGAKAEGKGGERPRGGQAAGGGPTQMCKWNEQMAVEGILDLPSVTETVWIEASGGLAFVKPETFASYMNRVPYKVADEKKAALLPTGWEKALKGSALSSKELIDFIHKNGVLSSILAIEGNTWIRVDDPMLSETYSKDAIMVTVSRESPKIPRFKKGTTAARSDQELGVTLEEVMKIIQEGKTEVMAEAQAICFKASDSYAMVVNQEIANMRMANEREGNIVKREFNDLCSRVRDIKDQTEEYKKEVGHLLPFMLAAKGGQQNDVQEPSVTLEKVSMLIEEGMTKVRAQLKEDSVAYVTQEEAAAAFDKKFEDKFDELKSWLMQNMGNQISTGASSASVARHHAPGGGARSTEQAALEEEKPRAKAAKKEEVEDKSL